MYADVVVDVRSDNLNESYTYLIPDALSAFVKAGTRVLVNFGMNDVLGYVIGITDAAPAVYNIKEIKAVLDFEQELTEEQISLAKYLKDIYHTSLTSTLSLMIPSFLKGKKRQFLVIKDYERLHPVLNLLFEGKMRILIDQKILAQYHLIKKEIDKGNITLDYDLYTYGRGKKQRRYFLAKDVNLIFLSNKRNKIINYLKDHPNSPEDDLCIVAECSDMLLKQMAKENILGVKEEFVPLLKKEEKKVHQEYCFNFDQSQTLTRYFSSNKKDFLLYANDHRFRLAFYLEIIKEGIKKDLPTVVVAPTIFILEEMFLFFKEHLTGCQVITMHSLNPKSDNYNTFMNVKYGNFDVVLVTGCNLFLPFRKLAAIIVIDEESDYYLNDVYPYYDTITVAKKWAELLDCKLLLASSSPSIDTSYQAEMGKIELLKSGKPLIGNSQIIDMKEEILRGSGIVLSNTLIEKIKTVVAESKQVILYLNNKAHANLIKCRECGAVLKCPRCGIPLSLYKAKHVARCNYCDYKVADYDTCLKCGSKNITTFGFGLEQVSESLKLTFPHLRLLRIDADNMKKASDYEKAILAIEEGDVDIIFGTDIFAKYVNSNIGLICCLSIDRFLNANNYKACEHTYNMLSRFIAAPNFLVQTYYPLNSVINAAMNGMYDEYYQEEIKIRKELEYPPFYELNRIVVSGEYKEMYHFANYFRKVYLRTNTGTLLGPVYDNKLKGLKLILKHNKPDAAYKIYEDTKWVFRQSKILTSFERRPKEI